PVQRAVGGGAWTAVRVRLALRARFAPPGAADLPRAVPAVGIARDAVHDGRRERVRRRHGQGGAAPLHLAADAMGEPEAWTASTVAAAGGQPRRLLVAGRTRRREPRATLRDRRRTSRRRRGPPRVCGRDRRR